MAYSVGCLSLTWPPVLLGRGSTIRRTAVSSRVVLVDALAHHVVIVGGPETTDELLAIVLDDGEAIPLFDSVEEAETFLASIGDYGRDWRGREGAGPEVLEIPEDHGGAVENTLDPREVQQVVGLYHEVSVAHQPDEAQENVNDLEEYGFEEHGVTR